MAVEVELKAWVSDPAAMRLTLAQNGTRERAYEKRDRYYSADGTTAAARFRIRLDDDRAVCTFKRKAIHDGIEQNEEHEFEVSDHSAFDRFAAFLGYSCAIEKLKRGESWTVSGITCELSEVPPLGWFLELEVVLDDDDVAEQLSATRERLIGLLAQLGLDRSAVEQRPYTQMLDEARRAAVSGPQHSL